MLLQIARKAQIRGFSEMFWKSVP